LKATKEYPHVFSPLKVGNITLKNRIQFSPMVCCLSSETGEATNDYVEFLGMQARTGAALVTIGATSVDDETGTDFRGELKITSDDNIKGLTRIAEEVHRYGAKLSVEMCHAGRGAAPYLLRKPEAIAPTPFPTDHGTRYIKEMDQRDIDHVIHQYADCAQRLKTANFDMVMVHCAHGNLLAQFLSPYSNKRNDYYGGSFENRIRFPLEVIKAVREAVGPDFPLEMRISGDEVVEGGMRIDDTLEFLKIAQEYINLVHISKGLIVDDNYSFYTLPPYYHPYCHNIDLAAQAKKVLHIPVATVGSIKTIAQAEEILASGEADVVAMARQLMADPDTIKKAYCGKSDTTRPCLRCMEGCGRNVCLGAQIRCSINPTVGREVKYAEIRPALTKKKVMVVGGGAAGMMATQILVRRGHAVTLYEKSDSLGGQLAQICVLPFKDDLKQYKEWDVKTTMECGAKIRFGTTVTKELVEQENPDVLFIAAGAYLFTPNIPGIDGANVHDVISVDNGRVAVGQQVVVCGGGLSGLECALALAMKGKEVTVVDMIPTREFGKDMFIFNYNMLMMLLKKYQVHFIGESKVEKFSDTGVDIIDKNWNRSTLKADSIVTAFGMKSNKEIIEELGDIIAETYVVGDCDTVKGISNANTTAFNYAVEV
jgi:2,4-dienoyl-CoA reductase-like NADH-dependent reductase (Old Yellow Enzyme family)/thioredoxin reductase